jgi:hypothetical protein
MFTYCHVCAIEAGGIAGHAQAVTDRVGECGLAGDVVP